MNYKLFLCAWSPFLFLGAEDGVPCRPTAFVRRGGTGRPDRISFTDVGRPGTGRVFPFASNPRINGNNLYAPDLVRRGDVWWCYHGGWLTDGQTNDRIYLSVSTTLDPADPWSESRLAVAEGGYVHVNDPSVVIVAGVWWMVYTAARFVGEDFRDWINYSRSPDGIRWTPSAGTSSTEVEILDPRNLVGGTLTDIARPSLVHTEEGWKMWFDGRVDNAGGLHTFLAVSSGETPSVFTIVRKYPAVDGWPALFEPDIERRPDGTYVGVVQRRFKALYFVRSSDGINFSYSPSPILTVDDPAFKRIRVSNPGLLYDHEEDRVLGVGFGMTDNEHLVDHDVGFAACQYSIRITSPGNVIHSFAQADLLDRQGVLVFEFTEFEKVRLLDPLTSETIFEQEFTEARRGDVWKLECAGETPSPPVWNTGVDDAETALPDRTEDPHWHLVQSPDSAYPGPRVWTVKSDEFPIPPWIANTSKSAWITARTDGASVAPGDYIYRLSFDLSGFKAAAFRLAGRFTADDSIAAVVLNGTDTGITASGLGFFEEWHDFEITQPLKNGINTLDITVANGGSSPNPSGLRVEIEARVRSVLLGDVNADGELDIADVVTLLETLFAGGTRLVCSGASDFNRDGDTDISDAVAMLIHLFASGPPPAPTTVPCLK